MRNRYIPQVWQMDKDYPSHLPADEALGISHIALKTHDGIFWMSQYDTHPLAVGRTHWAGLVDIYAKAGITAIPWCVPQGLDVPVETSLASGVLTISGRLILDVEVEPGQFWQGGKEAIKPYLEGIRERHPKARLDLQYDSRWPAKIWLEEWLPYVDSLISMDYWTTFQRPMDDVLWAARVAMASTGKPWQWTFPADASHYPGNVDREEVLIWRRGTMSQACIDLVRSGGTAEPMPDPVATLQQQVADLYREQVRQAVMLQDLDEFLQAHVAQEEEDTVLLDLSNLMDRVGTIEERIEAAASALKD